MIQSEEIWQRLRDIFRKIFGEGIPEINPSTKNDDIEGWTSLNHAILIDTIEKNFNISFDFDDILTMQTIEDIFQKIEKLVNNAH
jgi:acyl carrier protein